MNQPILPALTGNAKLDAALRYAGVGVGAAVVGVAVGFAKAHGWWVPDKDTLGLITQAIGGLIVVAYLSRAGTNAVTKSENAVRDSTIAAATTGLVPAVIAARATPAQVAAIDASPMASVAPEGHV